MKFLVHFHGLPFSIEIEKDDENFKCFMEQLSTQLHVPSDLVKIKFDNQMEIDKNYIWPVFRLDFLKNQDIFIVYDKKEILSDDKRFLLEELKKCIDRMMRTNFSYSTLGSIRCSSDRSNMEGGKLHLEFKSDKSPFSTHAISIRLVLFILHDNIYFYVNSYDEPFRLGEQDILRVGKIVPIQKNIDEVLSKFKASFTWAFTNMFGWQSHPFLSLCYDIKLRILKHVTSLKDYKNLCLTCHIMAVYLKDVNIWRHFFYQKFRTQPKSLNPCEEYKKRVTSSKNMNNCVYPGQYSIMAPIISMNNQNSVYYIPGVIGGPHDMSPFGDPYDVGTSSNYPWGPRGRNPPEFHDEIVDITPMLPNSRNRRFYMDEYPPHENSYIQFHPDSFSRRHY